MKLVCCATIVLRTVITKITMLHFIMRKLEVAVIVVVSKIYPTAKYTADEISLNIICRLLQMLMLGTQKVFVPNTGKQDIKVLHQALQLRSLNHQSWEEF